MCALAPLLCRLPGPHRRAADPSRVDHPGAGRAGSGSDAAGLAGPGASDRNESVVRSRGAPGLSFDAAAAAEAEGSAEGWRGASGGESAPDERAGASHNIRYIRNELARAHARNLARAVYANLRAGMRVARESVEKALAVCKGYEYEVVLSEVQLRDSETASSEAQLLQRAVLARLARHFAPVPGYSALFFCSQRGKLSQPDQGSYAWGHPAGQELARDAPPPEKGSKRDEALAAQLAGLFSSEKVPRPGHSLAAPPDHARTPPDFARQDSLGDALALGDEGAGGDKLNDSDALDPDGDAHAPFFLCVPAHRHRVALSYHRIVSHPHDETDSDAQTAHAHAHAHAHATRLPPLAAHRSRCLEAVLIEDPRPDTRVRPSTASMSSPRRVRNASPRGRARREARLTAICDAGDDGPGERAASPPERARQASRLNSTLSTPLPSAPPTRAVSPEPPAERPGSVAGTDGGKLNSSNHPPSSIGSGAPSSIGSGAAPTLSIPRDWPPYVSTAQGGGLDGHAEGVSVREKEGEKEGENFPACLAHTHTHVRLRLVCYAAALEPDSASEVSRTHTPHAAHAAHTAHTRLATRPPFRCARVSGCYQGVVRALSGRYRCVIRALSGCYQGVISSYQGYRRALAGEKGLTGGCGVWRRKPAWRRCPHTSTPRPGTAASSPTAFLPRAVPFPL
jgi:hypothetical protein